VTARVVAHLLRQPGAGALRLRMDLVPLPPKTPLPRRLLVGARVVVVDEDGVVGEDTEVVVDVEVTKAMGGHWGWPTVLAVATARVAVHLLRQLRAGALLGMGLSLPPPPNTPPPKLLLVGAGVVVVDKDEKVDVGVGVGEATAWGRAVRAPGSVPLRGTRQHRPAQGWPIDLARGMTSLDTSP